MTLAPQDLNDAAALIKRGWGKMALIARSVGDKKFPSAERRVYGTPVAPSTGIWAAKLIGHEIHETHE